MTVRTAAPVSRGSPETGRLVKVKKIVNLFKAFLYLGGRVLQSFLLIVLSVPQTSMSAQRMPIPATRMPFVPIVTVRTTVLVKRGSLETGRPVKVLKKFKMLLTGVFLKALEFILVR